jgi:hypothetical protein
MREGGLKPAPRSAFALDTHDDSRRGGGAEPNPARFIDGTGGGHDMVTTRLRKEGRRATQRRGGTASLCGVRILAASKRELFT